MGDAEEELVIVCVCVCVREQTQSRQASLNIEQKKGYDPPILLV